MIFNYALIEKRIAFVKEEIIGLVKVVYSYLVYVVLLYSVKWSKNTQNKKQNRMREKLFCF